MPSSTFLPEAVGMCPATLLVDPTLSAAADVEQMARATAAAGFPSVSLWSRHATAGGVETTRALFDDLGVTVRVIEGLSEWIDGPGPAIAAAEEQLDVASSLGADIVLAVTMLPAIDFPRATDGFAAACERADARGMRIAVEFFPSSAIHDLATAWRLVDESGARNGGIVIDMLHWYHQEGGPNVELLRQIPGERVHFVQVCDANAGASPTVDEYLPYAMGARAVPGKGVVDIKAFNGTLEAIGADPYFAFEVFNAELAQSGADVMAARLRTVAETLFD